MMQVDNKQILLLAPIRFNEIFYCESQTELGGRMCLFFVFIGDTDSVAFLLQRLLCRRVLDIR